MLKKNSDEKNFEREYIEFAAVLGNIVAVGCSIFAVGEYIARMAVYNLRYRSGFGSSCAINAEV